MKKPKYEKKEFYTVKQEKDYEIELVKKEEQRRIAQEELKKRFMAEMYRSQFEREKKQ